MTGLIQGAVFAVLVELVAADGSVEHTARAMAKRGPPVEQVEFISEELDS